MRRTKAEAAQTRQRIIGAAAEEFRRNGIAATGLNGLMAAAGLTHGGFYKHFASKDQLVEEACADMLTASVARYTERLVGLPAPERLAAIVTDYLSPQHRDRVAEGCCFAALAAEMGRGTDALRDVAGEGFTRLVNAVRGALPDPESPEAAARARVTAVTLIGAVTMARAVADPDLSDAILRDARDSLLRPPA